MTVGLRGFVGGGFAIVGGFMLLIALNNLVKIGCYSLFGTTAQGVVFTSESSSTSRGSSSAPVVRFTDAAGSEHRVTGRVSLRRTSSGRSRMTHEIGAIVQVAYPEGEPEKAVIADGRAVAWMSFLTVFAALLVGLGVWLIRFDRRMLREEGWLD